MDVKSLAQQCVEAEPAAEAALLRLTAERDELRDQLDDKVPGIEERIDLRVELAAAEESALNARELQKRSELALLRLREQMTKLYAIRDLAAVNHGIFANAVWRLAEQAINEMDSPTDQAGVVPDSKKTPLYDSHAEFMGEQEPKS